MRASTAWGQSFGPPDAYGSPARAYWNGARRARWIRPGRSNRFLPINVGRPRPRRGHHNLSDLRASDALLIALPILSLWIASPFFTWWISRPIARYRVTLTDDQTMFLRKMARKTWAFFETYVGPDDHWLPPDNYQEHPVPKWHIAHRRRIWDWRSSRIYPHTTLATSRREAS